MAVRACGFGGAAVVVEAVEFLGELVRRGGVLVRKSSTTSLAMSMRPAALMRGAMRKPTSVAVGGRLRGILRDLHEGAEAGLDGVAEFAQAEGGDDAVFAGERDGVGDGGDGDELEEGGDEACVLRRCVGFGVGGGFGCARRRAWASLKATAAPQRFLKG